RSLDITREIIEREIRLCESAIGERPVTLQDIRARGSRMGTLNRFHREVACSACRVDRDRRIAVYSSYLKRFAPRCRIGLFEVADNMAGSTRDRCRRPQT